MCARNKIEHPISPLLICRELLTSFLSRLVSILLQMINIYVLFFLFIFRVARARVHTYVHIYLRSREKDIRTHCESNVVLLMNGQ